MELLASILPMAVKFFLVANPIGNSPAILALTKSFPFKQQRRIILRETFIALLIALFFQFFGEFFLGLFNIKDYSLTLTGGILLLLVALKMIFSSNVSTENPALKQEPFIVPIATPIITGPGLMAFIMLYSRLEPNTLFVSLAILLAWIGITIILGYAPYLQRALGQRGLIALEQLMGMVLSFMSMEMIVSGTTLFIKHLTA